MWKFSQICMNILWYIKTIFDVMNYEKICSKNENLSLYLSVYWSKKISNSIKYVYNDNMHNLLNALNKIIFN